MANQSPTGLAPTLMTEYVSGKNPYSFAGDMHWRLDVAYVNATTAPSEAIPCQATDGADR